MDDDAQAPVNPFAAYQHLLSERLHLLLAALHPALYADVVQALEAEGKLLSQLHRGTDATQPTLPAGVWPLLTLLVAQHINPAIDPFYASSVAVTVECFVCALDLLDDIEDEDQTPIVRAIGSARVLNVSTTLLTLAHQAILSLSLHNVASADILRLLETLQESALIATAGQHRDLLAEQRSAHDITQEECIEIAAAKAGSIMRLACRLGALCAGASHDLCEQFSKLGELLGIAHQLDNDSHDLYYLLQDYISAAAPMEVQPAPASTKTDILRGKKTLPVVLATRGNDILQRLSMLTDEEKKEHLHALQEGIITTWGISLLYRERAHDHLQKIEAQQSVAPALRLLLGL